MTPLTIVLLVVCVILIVAIVFLAKKRKWVLAAVTGLICAGLLAAILALSIVEKPLQYLNQTKENYLAMQEDKNIAGFRIVVDNKIVNRFPEWDEEHPFQYRIIYQSSEIRITTID